MKNQKSNEGQLSEIVDAGNNTFSRVLLVVAILLYSVSLVLLASLAMAETKSTVGALIKVNNQLDGEAFADLHVDVKSVSGNILAIDLPRSSAPMMQHVKGLCSSQTDYKANNLIDISSADMRSKYAGTGVVIGILNNNGKMSEAAFAALKKVETASNIGFISYESDNPNSTVIMHNLESGESNLIHALRYMVEYAQIVGRPLVIELNAGSQALNNPLFVQVCQKYSDTGVQFIGGEISTSILSGYGQIQLSFSMFNPITEQITDQTDFWAIEEVKQQQLMLLGSDENTCSIFFQTEAGIDKLYLSNQSHDLVLVTAITADGNVSYYHIANKEIALIPRKLRNGTPILEDGLAGVFPYHSKGALFNNAIANKQFVTLRDTNEHVKLEAKNGLSMSVGSPSSGTLAMTLDNITSGLRIEVSDSTGETVYRSQPSNETRSMKTRIDLSSGDGGLYFLHLTAPGFHQTFALQMN